MAASLEADWGRAYLGIPHRHGGRGSSGCDCWGLARLILAQRFGLELPCLAEAAPAPDDYPAIEAVLLGGLRAHGWTEVTAGEEEAGDLALMHVLFRDPEGRAFRTAVAHVGLVLAPGLLIHVERGGDGGAVMARYRGRGRDRALARRIAGFRRHPRLPAPPSRHAGG